MTTYNYTAAELSALLDEYKAPAGKQAITTALTNAHLLPSGADTIAVTVETGKGSYTLSGFGQLFLYAGPDGTTATVDDLGGNVLADPGSIAYIGTGNETLIGGDGALYLSVLQGDNLLQAGAGANTLYGGSGGDTLYGGGDSSLVAGSGANVLRGGRVVNAHDTLIGGSGASRMGVLEGDNLLQAGAGANTLYGGSGGDTLYGGGDSSLVAGSGANVLRGGRVVNAHDTLIGGSGASRMGVLEGDNLLQAGAGANTLYGGSGGDTLYGGGDSSLVAGSGANVLRGGRVVDAHDTLIGGTGASRMGVLEGDNLLQAGAGANTLYGGAGGDTLYGGGDSSLVAGSGANVLRGGRLAGAHDTLVGGSGAQRMGLLDGNNLVYGGDGFDSVWTGAGNDTVNAGSGNISITGGSGSALVNTGNGNATVFGGSGSMSVQETHTLSDIVSQHTIAGGALQIVFSNNQVLQSKDATITFHGGGTIVT